MEDPTPETQNLPLKRDGAERQLTPLMGLPLLSEDEIARLQEPDHGITPVVFDIPTKVKLNNFPLHFVPGKINTMRELQYFQRFQILYPQLCSTLESTARNSEWQVDTPEGNRERKVLRDALNKMLELVDVNDIKPTGRPPRKSLGKSKILFGKPTLLLIIRRFSLIFLKKT